MITMSDVIAYLRNDAAWSINGNDYSTLVWYSQQAAPTEQEINDAWSEAESYYARSQASLTRAEFKLALLAGGYLDDVEAMMNNPATPRGVQIMWDDSSRFDRLHPELLAMAAQMGYTDAQMDALFGIA